MTTCNIYTVDACINNGKHDARAGWGAALTNPAGDVLELAGPVPSSQPQTNSRAELLAVVALDRCAKPTPMSLHTDKPLLTLGYLHYWDKGMRVPADIGARLIEEG